MNIHQYSMRRFRGSTIELDPIWLTKNIYMYYIDHKFIISNNKRSFAIDIVDILKQSRNNKVKMIYERIIFFSKVFLSLSSKASSRSTRS